MPPRERGRPARTMPRHSLGHLRHSDRPGTAPWVSLGLAVEVHTDRLAACQVALTLSDLHKGIRMRAGRPRSQEMPITPPLRGTRRSRAERRRLMRWGVDADLSGRGSSKPRGRRPRNSRGHQPMDLLYNSSRRRYGGAPNPVCTGSDSRPVPARPQNRANKALKISGLSPCRQRPGEKCGLIPHPPPE